MTVPPIMQNPQFKVNITHWGTSTNYIDSDFSSINVKRRVNGYDTATLTCGNPNGGFYKYQSKNLDEIKVYFKDASASTWTQVFGGYTRQALPAFNGSLHTLTLNCKGYASALEETHCNRAYGAESDNDGIDTAKEIATDIVDNFVEKSLGDAATGYSFTNYIADIAAATPIKYMNNPYRANTEALDELLKLVNAINGTTAGAEYIIDPSGNFLFNTIGAHENQEYWPTWVNYTQADSTYTQGIDFTTLAVTDKSDEFANKVILATDFRKPAYDYWTENSGGAALWGNEGLDGVTDENGANLFVVGSHSLKIDPDGANQGYAYYPSTADAAWNIEKWGSTKTIPMLNFYCRKHALTTASTYVVLSDNSTARKTDYFYAKFMDWASEGDDKWYHKAIPIGPYWKTAVETNEFRWNEQGSPDWANIDSLEFGLLAAGAGGALYIDDLHFTGKIVRSAKNSTSISANKEYQKVLINREAVDDSCVDSDDTGYAARIAYAELLRRQKLPYTVTFQIRLTPQMMPGQLCHLHAFKLSDGSTYTINADHRILEVKHNYSANCTTTVTATSDLTNSFPISVPDQYQIMIENMLVNSGEAKNMRATNEVDLIIPLLDKDYPS